MYIPPVYKLRDFGKGRFTKRNPSKLPPGAARDSLNVNHDLGNYSASARVPVGRAYASRPATPTYGVLGMHELVRAAGTAIYLVKVDDKLYSTAAIDSAGWTNIITGSMDTAWIAQFATLGDRAYIADRTKNYITNGALADTVELQKTGPYGAFSGVSAGTATGNAAADIVYWYTDQDPDSNMECPPSAATGFKITVARAANQGVTLTFTGVYSGTYTKKKVYRIKAGDQQPFYVGTITSPTTTLADTSLDTDLTVISTVHDQYGVPSIEKPQAAEHMCVHRGRLWIAYGSTLAWSRLYEGTQFENFSWSKIQVDPNDGDRITGIVSFRGSLIVFKKRSIHIVNGSTNDRQFVCAPFTNRVGARCPRSIVVEDDSIFFLTEQAGVFGFDLNSVNPVSTEIEDEVTSGLAWTDAACDLVCAGYNRFRRQYLLSVRRSGESYNTRTHVLNVRSGAWGRNELCGNKAVPSCYAEMRNGSSVQKLYVGVVNGYAYEFESSVGADGVRGGDKSATITSNSGSIINCSTANFYGTGDKLKGLNATIVTAAGVEYVTEITVNTSTQLGVSTNFGSTDLTGATVYIGWMESVLSLGRLDMEEAGYKVVTRLNVSWEKQSHSVPLYVGYTVDGDAAPTSSKALVMNGGYRGSINVNDRFVGFSPYFRISGVDYSFELVLLEVPFRLLQRRLPSR